MRSADACGASGTSGRVVTGDLIPKPPALLRMQAELYAFHQHLNSWPFGHEHVICSRLSKFPLLCDLEGMKVRRLIGFFLAVLVTVGLVAAPMVTLAAVKCSPATQMVDMSAMSDDMPCCPDGQKNKGCQECPLVATCMSKIAQVGPSSVDGIPAPLPAQSQFLATNDLIADGLMGPPPDHPPRTSI